MIATRIPEPRRARWLRLGSIGAALLIVVLGFLQSSVFPWFAIAGVRPAVVLMAAITMATVSDDARALYWGFGGGLLVDLLSASPLGLNALIFTLLVFVVGGQGRGFDRANLLFPVLAGAAATVLYYPALVLALQLQGFDIDWGKQVWDRLPRAVAVNAGAAIVLYPAVRLAEKWTRPRSGARFLARSRDGFRG